jgi:hypothetical protein
MKAATILIAACIILAMFGGVMAAIHSFRGVDFTEPHIITTGGGVTTATITLAADVMDDENTNISVTSTNALDAPVPFAYTSTTRQLTVNGLAASDTRTLTITYPVLRLDAFSDTAARFFPAYLILALLCCIGGAAYAAFRRGED